MALQTTLEDGTRRIQKTLTIGRPINELYEFWRDFERLPQFMNHVEAVMPLDDTSSHWMVLAPAGRTVEWDAQITEDIPGERIAWKSLPGADVENGGEVIFRPAPADRGTEVSVALHYKPPAGGLGVIVAKLFGEDPSQQLDEDLYRFKQLMETGLIPDNTGQPVGGKLLEKEERREQRAERREQREARRRARRTHDEEVQP